MRADLGRLRMHATTVLSFFLGALLTLLLCVPPLLADPGGGAPTHPRARADSRPTRPEQ